MGIWKELLKGKSGGKVGQKKKKIKTTKKAEMGLNDEAYGGGGEEVWMQRNALSELVLEEEMGQIPSPV